MAPLEKQAFNCSFIKHLPRSRDCQAKGLRQEHALAALSGAMRTSSDGGKRGRTQELWATISHLFHTVTKSASKERFILTQGLESKSVVTWPCDGSWRPSMHCEDTPPVTSFPPTIPHSLNVPLPPKVLQAD